MAETGKSRLLSPSPPPPRPPPDAAAVPRTARRSTWRPYPFSGPAPPGIDTNLEAKRDPSGFPSVFRYTNFRGTLNRQALDAN